MPVMQLCDLLTRELGSDAILKVRTSPGFRTGKNDGNFNERAVDEVDMAGIDSEKALTVSLSLDGNSLKEGDELYAQAAMLYTNAWGQRRIRVHNLRVVATENLANVFRHADVDVIMCHFMRRGAW